MFFLDGFFNEELFWLSFGDLITNIVIATVIIGEIGFVIWLLLKWLRGNIKLNWSPVLHIGESGRRRSDSSVKNTESWEDDGNLPPKNMGPIEVDVNKNIVIDKVDNKSIEMDDVVHKKVKNNKDKLKKLMKG